MTSECIYYCACCQLHFISQDNPKAQDQDLCDDCFDKLFRNDQDEIVGWLKSELNINKGE